MNRKFLDEINVAKRDALVAFQMSCHGYQYVEQLYDYYLMDPLPGKEVVLSEVTEAVASMQHFLSRIANGQEPGLQMAPEDTRDWNNATSRYSLWAGYRRLRAYPENYLDPTTRRGKTAAFSQLESRLGQGRIDADAVQSAVLGYLNDFEKVCNLDVLDGFWDDDPGAQKIYFVARPKRSPQTTYYWRELSLDRTNGDGSRLLPTAWSEWRKIDSVSSGVLDDMIKPVFLNGRLYVVWCEKQEKRVAGASGSSGSTPNASADPTKTEAPTYVVRLAYKKFDDSWSEPLQLFATEQPGSTSPGQLVPPRFYAAAVHAEDDTGVCLSIFLVWPGQDLPISAKFDAALNRLMSTNNDVSQAGLLSKIQDQTKTGKSKQIAGKFIDQFVSEKKYFRSGPANSSPWAVAFRKALISIEPAITTDKLSLTIIVPTLSSAHGGSSFNYIITVLQQDRFGRQTYWLRNEAQCRSLVVPGNSDGGLKFACTAPNIPLEPVGIQVVVGLIVTTTPVGAEADTSQWAYDAHVAGVLFRPKPPARTTPAVDAKPADEDAGSALGVYVDRLAPEAQDKPQFIHLGPAGSGNLGSVQINTLCVKDLINHAYAGVDAIFSQQLAISSEPGGSSSSDPGPQDPFQGANALYFWELFFHTPFLVAYRLVQEGRFADARKWLGYIFDPSAANSADRWVFEPFKDPGVYDSHALPALPRDGFPDPDELAIASPIRYKKAILFLYVNSLIGQGDACYRELERDSINEAMQWYMQALSMLGSRPRAGQQLHWKDVNIGEVNGTVDASAVSASNPLGRFYLPINQTLLEFWDRIDSRLHNLRHSLTIDGKPMSLPAFDPPADPALLAQLGPGGPGSSTSRLLQREETYPDYRFQVLLARAYAASESLIQFGNALQAALERKDATHLERLQQSQLIDLQQFTLQIQRDTITASRASLASLNSAQESAIRRNKYYIELAADRSSDLETAALALRATGSGLTTGSHAVRAVGAALDLAPNIFGTSDGGMRYGAPAYALADGALAAAEATMQAGYLIETAEQYRRRQQEWQQMADQASDEKAQLATQISAQQALVSQYENQLNQIQMQHSQQRDMSEFMSSRFSSEELYFWMSSQLAELYAQAYDATISVCQMAQSAWRWETGKFDRKVSYIRPGAWIDRYAGLLKGEQLKLCLQRLENDFLSSSSRKLEIIHTVSLKELGKLTALATDVSKLVGQSASGGGNKEHGDDPIKVSFSLNAKDFNDRYPGHILRQIVAVTITLPGVVGPYQDVRAILTQTKNEIVYSDGASNQKKEDLRSKQQVALSTGLDDSGLFALNFGDERYLPFEGTGAHSSWELEFPRARDQLAFLQSLTDVIVRIRYTALPASSGPSA